MNKKWLWVMVLFVASLLVVGGWILTRSRTDNAKTASLTPLKSTEANNVKPNEPSRSTQGRDLCGGTGGIGQIISLGTNAITIQRKNGSTQIVNLSGQTAIKTPAGSASQSDLKIGDAVTLVGGPNSDGSFTAETILVCGGLSSKAQAGGADVSNKPDATAVNSTPSVPPKQLRH